jgi:peptidoglycan/LPS O-acetylase OafA/YrhL
MSASESLAVEPGRQVDDRHELRPAAATAPTPDKLDYIDAVRGWAILLVMTAHAAGAVGGVPYPLHKLTNFGWYGVQLFFLASAVTLMMSWRRSDVPNWIAIRDFFIRRFWRIAPMYYAGALIYLVFSPPVGGFDPIQFLRTLGFVNAWAPDWIPTTALGWRVVPGGWSISVEFTFYALFPLLAFMITNLRRAFMLFGIALVGAMVANHYGARAFAATDPQALGNFLYFWFPNQAPIFALGIVLFHLLAKIPDQRLTPWVTYSVVAGVAGVSLVVAEAPWQPWVFASPIIPPPMLVATAALMLFVIALAKGPRTVFAHPWIQRVGVLSFSCYVLHFLFVDLMSALATMLMGRPSGLEAVGKASLVWAATIVATIVFAAVTHDWIEKPGMRLAKRLTRRSKPLAVAANVAG